MIYIPFLDRRHGHGGGAAMLLLLLLLLLWSDDVQSNHSFTYFEIVIGYSAAAAVLLQRYTIRIIQILMTK